MENDKTYMWLSIITFVLFTAGLFAGVNHMNSYKDEGLTAAVQGNPFAK
ncbi:MAG: hypothetical protein PF961_03660 [Planctomycetota bacterium]|jgi:hypothetical protein|nr:hypothetical protein [Planctomycetota bacterium]